MNPRIEQYIQSIFEHVSPSPESNLLRTRMLQQLQAAYDAQLSQNDSEERAFLNALASIKDLEAQMLTLPNPLKQQAYEVALKRKARFTAFGITVILLGVAAFIGFSALPLFEQSSIFGLVCLLIFVGVGVGLIVYAQSSMPKQGSQNQLDFLVSDPNASMSAKKYAGYRSILYLIALIIYLLVSFTSGAWGITWIIWIIAALIEQIMLIILANRKS